MSSDCEFTVFTATYNRAHLLHRVYGSLLAQTFRDFEWLVIDDGSTDDTESLIRKWCSEADFPIRYHYQRNQGKHVACNRAVGMARGRFFLPLDSDDACVPDALAMLHHYWDTIPQQQKGAFSAVTVLCKDERGEVVGDRFPDHITDSNSLDCYYKLKVRGEKWGFHRTDVMREFPFPVPGKRMPHVPESIVWSSISRRYKTRFVNEALRIYYTGHESLTSPGNLARSARAYRMWNRFVLEHHLDFLKYDPMEFMRHAANLSRFSLHLGESAMQQIWSLNTLLGKILCWSALAVGTAKYVADRRCGRVRIDELS